MVLSFYFAVDISYLNSYIEAIIFLIGVHTLMQPAEAKCEFKGCRKYRSKSLPRGG